MPQRKRAKKSKGRAPADFGIFAEATAVVSTKVNIGPEPQMVAATKRSISECLEGDGLFVETVRDEMITGNHAGVNLARQITEIPVMFSQLDQLRKDVEKLGVELAGTKQELAGTKQELAGTQQELAGTQQELAGTQQELAGTKQELAGTKQELSESQHASDQFGLQARAQFSNGFANIRNRFLSSFRRDVLNDTAVENQQLIRIGNARAHEGHFVADASLYEENSRYLDKDGKVHPPRSDRGTFVLLYGVDPSLAKEIGKF
ncbi:hypothetical protein AtubIFM55763_007101 [Aspergillus tubingensis]|nr:hypothetical protein AtubIFM55763_007101 [Aspergillus tubingensis]